MDKDRHGNSRTTANPSAGQRNDSKSGSNAKASQAFRHGPPSCLAKARAIFSCYRRDEAQDPEGFVANLSLVLGDYAAVLVDLAADPRTGIITAFPLGLPNVGQIQQWLEGQRAKKERLEHFGALPKYQPSPRLPRPPAGPGAFANVFVASSLNVYARFVEKAKTADVREYRYSDDPDKPGIHVALGWFDQPAAAAKGLKPLSDDDLRALYPKPATFSEVDAA